MALIKIFASMINGVWSKCNKETTIECGPNVASITPAYMTRKECCGGKVEHQVSLVASADPTNDIAGTLITMVDGRNFFLNGVTVDEVSSACNACCGAISPLADNATGAFTASAAPSAKCLTTTGDDGSVHFASRLGLRLYPNYDETKGFSRFDTNKFTFYSTDAAANIIVPAGWTVADGACS